MVATGNQEGSPFLAAPGAMKGKPYAMGMEAQDRSAAGRNSSWGTARHIPQLSCD